MAFAQAEDHAQIQSVLDSLSLADPAAMIIFRVQLPESGMRWQEWVIRGISGPNSSLVEFQAVGRDITERKNMEEQIQTTQLRLVQASRLASIGQLAASVAHQISNPLTTIIADAQMLLRAMKPNNPGFESTEAIVEAGWRAQQVISELMKFSQPTDDRRELIYVNETIEKALLLSTAHLHAGGAVLDLMLPEVSAEIHGNERQMVDLWVNLLLAPLNLELGIPTIIHIQATESPDGIITVRFINDGVHIPASQLSTLFDPQLIPAGGKGTGIEMSICREILRQHNGEISVRCDQESTIFEITLPKREAA
jgi:two-component system sensor histidine kinase AtoS